MTNNVNIGEIEVSSFDSIDSLIEKEIILDTGIKPGVAIAINPEKVIAARHDFSIMQILNQATLKYPDGAGVAFVMSKKLNKKVPRIPGCELWERLMYRSAETQVPVYLLGASEEVISTTKEKLISQGVNVVGYQNGFFDHSNPESVIKAISDSGAKIVSVALGSPKQELFIFECKKFMPDVFFMGVGGTYDVFTNNVKRAPKMFRLLNLEWLYRLLSQPSRLFRQGRLVEYIGLYLKGRL
ncbi:hypothetical protein PULV_a3409 [Pseudoalteromonas ulvae UL12]|nr:WecB/TagA/CpsF family glycosyltransferase [Pseudoalteromonas ulvae]MBE0365096.1 hypothetical protein [Pseudoalteromonas ulvae UL12]